jgi:hypothetical protein
VGAGADVTASGLRTADVEKSMLQRPGTCSMQPADMSDPLVV